MGKKNTKLKFFFLAVFSLAAVGFLVMNNLDLSSKTEKSGETNPLNAGEPDESPEEDVPGVVAPQTDEGKLEPRPEAKKKSSSGRDSGKGQSPPAADPFSFTTPKIICPLKTEPLLYVILKAKLKYSGKNLKKELEFRKKDVEGIIQNIIYLSEREDLTAVVIRKKIINSLNTILHEGKIDDLVFVDFKIEIRKK